MAEIKVSKKVYIRQRPRVVQREGVQFNDQDANRYVGSCYQGQEVLRGLDFEEEKIYLKDILGTNPNSEKWEEACKRYWANIRVRVPYGLGYEMEIGFKYKDQETADLGEADGNYETKQKYGKPIKVSDYILWRYCLVYGRVANTLAEVNNSNKIRFYLYNEEIEINDKYAAQQLRKNAFAKFLQVVGDRELVEQLLIIYNDPVYAVKDDKKKDLALEAKMNENPTRFIAILNDPQLKMKALIESAILKGHLRRIDNTDTIIFGDNTPIGNSIDDAVAYLRNPNHVQTLNTIKARMQMLSEIRKPEVKESGIPEVKDNKDLLVSEDTDPLAEVIDTGATATATAPAKGISLKKPQ